MTLAHGEVGFTNLLLGDIHTVRLEIMIALVLTFSSVAMVIIDIWFHIYGGGGWYGFPTGRPIIPIIVLTILF